MIKSVFWDLDGTIAETELLGHRIAFNKAFSYFGFNWQWTQSDYIKLLSVAGGLNRIISYSESINNKISYELAKRIHLTKQDIYLDIIESGAIVKRTGVSRLVENLQVNNIDQWVVTTSSRNTTMKLLRSLFNDNSLPFSGVITSEDVLELKPSPEAYLLAMERSLSGVHNTIVIEDSLIGLKAAKSIALKCIVTLSPFNHKPISDYSKADIIVNHLGDHESPSTIFKGILSENIVSLSTLEQLFT